MRRLHFHSNEASVMIQHFLWGDLLTRKRWEIQFYLRFTARLFHCIVLCGTLLLGDLYY